jgi:hypothetical protein
MKRGGRETGKKEEEEEEEEEEEDREQEEERVRGQRANGQGIDRHVHTTTSFS